MIRTCAETFVTWSIASNFLFNLLAAMGWIN
jgi:hypothetical protein